MQNNKYNVTILEHLSRKFSFILSLNQLQAWFSPLKIEGNAFEILQY